MTASILELEQQDIELQLMEIQLKRRMVEIEREKLERGSVKKDVVVSALEGLHEEPVTRNCRCVAEPVIPLRLHYSKSARESVMNIAGVTREGCVLVRGKYDSSIISKKYNVRSLRWIASNLSKWSEKQKLQPHFWEKLAVKYSKKFLSGDKISRTTMEKLCYLVDSGLMDEHFHEYDKLRLDVAQSRLEI